MNNVSDVIKKFFKDYELASNTFEGDILVSLFSNLFMSAEPNGKVQVIKKDDFIAGISKRQAFFHSIGFKFVKVIPINEIRLDDSYVIVNAQSKMQFEKNQGQSKEITSSSSYILFKKGDLVRIVFYTTHENLMEIMKENGLIS